LLQERPKHEPLVAGTVSSGSSIIQRRYSPGNQQQQEKHSGVSHDEASSSSVIFRYLSVSRPQQLVRAGIPLTDDTSTARAHKMLVVHVRAQSHLLTFLVALKEVKTKRLITYSVSFLTSPRLSQTQVSAVA